MVLEKTLKSHLNCKEIKPVNPEGNQSWIVTGRTDAEAEAPILWPPDVKSQLRKDSATGKDWRQEKGTRWLDGITDSMTWVWASSGRCWRTGKPGVPQSVGLQRVGHDWATEQQPHNIYCALVEKCDRYKKGKVLDTQSCPDSLIPHGLQAARLLRPWNFPGKNTGRGSHSLLQGIFPT